MKTNIHRWLLGLTLLFLIPGTLLASLLLIGAIGSVVQGGFSARYIPGVLVLLVPPLMTGSGFHLWLGLRQGVHAVLRRKLLAYYLVVFCYCMFWLHCPMSHGDVAIELFSMPAKVIGSVLLVLPVGITLFTHPEEKRIWSPDACGTPLLRRRIDRFVAWLASRIR